VSNRERWDVGVVCRTGSNKDDDEENDTDSDIIGVHGGGRGGRGGHSNTARIYEYRNSRQISISRNVCPDIRLVPHIPAVEVVQIR
jgi:hypothetical protein